MVEEKSKNLDVYIVVSLLFLIIAVVVFSVLYKNNSSTNINTENSTITEPISYPEFDLSIAVPVTAPNNIIIKDNNVILINDWLVTGVNNQNSFEEMQCRDLSERCLIYKVSKGDYSFYVSDRELTSTADLNGTTFATDMVLDTSFGAANFNHYSVTSYLSSENSYNASEESNYSLTPSVTEALVSGCIKNNFCVSTNLLSNNKQENIKALDAFKDLLMSVVNNTQ